jgi:leucyl aminopeptidase
MKFYTTSKDITNLSADAVVCFAYQEDKKTVYSKELLAIDAVTKGMCRMLLKEEGFTAKLGSTFIIQTQGKLPYKKVVVVGLGKEKEMMMHDWQYVCAAIARRAKSAHIKTIVLPLMTRDDMNTAYGAVVGLGLGSYSFLVHKNKETQKEEHEIQKMTFVCDKRFVKETTQGIISGVIATDATTVTRDLVNEPPSITTPTYLASVAKSLARKTKNMRCRVFGKKEMKKLKMFGLLAVAQGSHEEPKFIKLTYSGGRKKTITLVGKGITYDSGGLSLKPQAGLETMKCDMAGAATILGVFQAIRLLKPKITIVGLIAACENMPGGGAIKPGDVVRALNGKTIEIVNTDAEGRVILADALSYADTFVKSDYIIDLATLTGACVVALGEDIAGLFTDNDALGERLLVAGTHVGETMWRMPIAKEYADHLKSEIADVRNVSKVRYGGAINGALFLKEFAPKDIPWAHIDIAGPAFAEKDSTLSPYGGTGFGVQTLLSFISEAEGKK